MLPRSKNFDPTKLNHEINARQEAESQVDREVVERRLALIETQRNVVHKHIQNTGHPTPDRLAERAYVDRYVIRHRLPVDDGDDHTYTEEAVYVWSHEVRHPFGVSEDGRIFEMYLDRTGAEPLVLDENTSSVVLRDLIEVLHELATNLTTEDQGRIPAGYPIEGYRREIKPLYLSDATQDKKPR